MITREFAVLLVQAQLERDYHAELATYGTSVRVAVSRVTEHALGWMVSWQSEDHLRTPDHRHALVGNGPYLVDKEDGSLHRVPVVDAVTGAWENDYLTRVKGRYLPGPVDALHDEVRSIADTQGRAHALRLLRRRVGGLSIRDATAYADALKAGQSPPADLLARAVEALPRPKGPVASGVETVTGPNTPTTAPFPAPTLPGIAPRRRRQTAERCRTPCVGQFRELSADYDHAPSIHDAATPEPRPHEAELVAYLRAGSVLAVSGSASYDVLRGDGTMICDISLQSDGTWFWNSALAYYVETYHLALDDRFLTHAAASGWTPRQLSLAEMLSLEDQFFDEDLP
ncbi:YrhB family protein [Streptomyces sp. NBC_00638]|uniref:YrhB domain-containing protein n=1 Tax=unclassified Streptomyces TaxID=2593676 RepID=UPI0022573B7F|nr:YrhB domain-containing protein [Streptomyces sp. NBC_00638]MCX5001237.1 YrhB family protein [Streptomyces sp. NBC_00638]